MSKKILAAMFATVLSLNAFADCECPENDEAHTPSVAAEEVSSSSEEVVSNEATDPEIVFAE
jgi:hypothetical protein